MESEMTKWMSFSLFTFLVLMLAVFKPSMVIALEFSDHYNGAMRIDGESSWIYVEGEFEIGDGKRFEEFLEGRSLWKNQRIVFNSGGGSVLEGIIIGEIIRNYGFRTAVARSVKIGGYSQVQPGICASACVLAFVGGIQRGASEGSKIGVHQMSRNYENTAKGGAYKVEDLESNMSYTQRWVGHTLTHFMQMGIHPSIVSLMVGTSADDIRWLTLDEVRSTKIAFDPSHFLPWAIEPYRQGLVAFSRSEDEKKQLTLYCGSSGKMRFLLRVQGEPFHSSYIAHVHVTQFEVAGSKVLTADIKSEIENDALILSGPWSGGAKPSERMSTFSLLGEAVGTISDLYSLYHFNRMGFAQSVELARKNCI
jgi:hypothetical protein